MSLTSPGYAYERRKSVFSVERRGDLRRIDKRIFHRGSPRPAAHLFLAGKQSVDLVIDERGDLKTINFEQRNGHGALLLTGIAGIGDSIDAGLVRTFPAARDRPATASTTIRAGGQEHETCGSRPYSRAGRASQPA